MPRNGYLFARLKALGIDDKAARHVIAYLASDGVTTNVADLTADAAGRVGRALTLVDIEINGEGAF